VRRHMAERTQRYPDLSVCGKSVSPLDIISGLSFKAGDG
jgi:hypothetical protein